jgi:hypothetical protein
VNNLPEGITYEDRNGVTADDFHKYCKENPELRFWQALRNWSGHSFILASEQKPVDDPESWEVENFLDGVKDTFNIEGKDGKAAK